MSRFFGVILRENVRSSLFGSNELIERIKEGTMEASKAGDYKLEFLNVQNNEELDRAISWLLRERIRYDYDRYSEILTVMW